MGTYKYEDIIKELLDNGERHLTIKENQISCRCPFHQESKASFGINMETGLYNCFSCSEKGNIVKFVSKMKDISTLQALDELEIAGYDIDRKSSGYYILKDYAKEKKLDFDFLSKTLKMETAPKETALEYHISIKMVVKLLLDIEIILTVRLDFTGAKVQKHIYMDYNLLINSHLIMLF